MKRERGAAAEMDELLATLGVNIHAVGWGWGHTDLLRLATAVQLKRIADMMEAQR